MKQILLLILTVIILSCENQSDKSFSNDFLLDHTGWLAIAEYDYLAVPSWEDDDSFWTAYENENRVLRKFGLDGSIQDEIVLYTYPDAPSRLSDPYVSSDGSTIVFTGELENSSTRDVFRIVPETGDHDLFTLNSIENVRLPNLNDLYITSPVYPWADKLGYLGTQLDYNTMKGTQNYYIYDFSTGNTQSFFLGIYDINYEGNVISGEYFFNPDIYADPVNPGSMDMIMFCVKLVEDTDSNSVYTVKMYNSDGSENYDGSTDFSFDQIGGLRWIDENSVLMTVKEGDQWKIISANESGVLNVFYSTDQNIYSLNGLSISPSKNRCLTQIKYDEYDSRSEILIVNLF